jgi:hypothetical protein
LRPLAGLADIRVVQCHVTAEEAVRRRGKDTVAGFQRLRPEGPEFHVDSTDGYRPELDEIIAFASVN